MHDDQHDDGPVQQLGEGTPAARGVSHGHAAKLMRVSASCKLRLAGAVLLAPLLGGCPLQPHAPAAPPRVAVETPAPHEGVPYDIVAGESPLTLPVYRGGALPSAGPHHLVAPPPPTRTVYVPAPVMPPNLQAPHPAAGV